MTEVTFNYGALADSFEKQANDQGFTFGEDAEFIEKVHFGIVAGHIHGIITDGEYQKILERFQKKMIIENIKKIEK